MSAETSNSTPTFTGLSFPHAVTKLESIIGRSFNLYQKCLIDAAINSVSVTFIIWFTTTIIFRFYYFELGDVPQLLTFVGSLKWLAFSFVFFLFWIASKLYFDKLYIKNMVCALIFLLCVYGIGIVGLAFAILYFLS